MGGLLFDGISHAALGAHPHVPVLMDAPLSDFEEIADA